MSATANLAFALLLLLVSFTAWQKGVAAARDLWCVAKNNAQDDELQAAINWACGPGGADCSPIQQGGTCYDATDIQKTASWAFNDYYLKHGLTDESCYFSNTAALTSLNPSFDNCKFPSSSTVPGGGNVSDSTSTTIGNGPASDSADFSTCSRIIATTWFWSLFFSVFTLHGLLFKCF